MPGASRLQYLIANSARWIAAQRDRFRPHAEPLDADLREALSPYFTSATLESARIARVPVVENPDFYEHLDDPPMDLGDSAGITYGDTMLLSARFVPGAPRPSLIFHELVHVVQYSVLGIPEFAHRYVHGWADNGFEYLRIPLEVQAYALEGRFREDALGDTVVEEWVASELGRAAG